MTRDEALLWMNDRIGRKAVVLVPGGLPVVSSRRVLAHGGQTLAEMYGDAATWPQRDGVYRIGDVAALWLPPSDCYVADERSLHLEETTPTTVQHVTVKVF